MKKILLLISVLFVSYASFGLAPISGTTTVCVGASSSLYDVDTTGTWSWSSSNPSVASISSASGYVTSVSVGTTTITFTEGSAYVTATFVVNGPVPAAITGATSVCPGSSITLSDATSGGTWSSGATTMATVGAGTGLVTGVATGHATIYYTLSSGCFATLNVTVDSTSVDTIMGVTGVCAGAYITLDDTEAGGVWTSSNVAVATVSAGGLVEGIASGTANISYTVTGACGTYYTYKTITVNPGSSAGTISGSSSVDVGLATTLSDGMAGGTWASSNTAIATVDSSTGVVTGVAPGTATITYTVTGCTGTVYATYVISVTTINGISGYVEFTGPSYYGNVKVWVITFNPSTSMLEAIDSTTVTCRGTGSVYYQFLGLATDSLRVKASQLDSTSATGYIPTYHTSSFYWHDATVLYHISGTEDINQDINMSYGALTSGPGFIGGNVTTGANRGTSGSIAATGLLIYLINPTTGNVIQQAITDASGNYSFSNLPLAAYTVYPELINYTTSAYYVNLTASSDSVSKANFIQHTKSHTITPGTTGIAMVNPAVSSAIAFPNPTTGMLNIQWQETATENGNLTISDITGREVYKTTLDMTQGSGINQLDLSALTNGMYIISVKSGSINYNDKVEVLR